MKRKFTNSGRCSQVLQGTSFMFLAISALFWKSYYDAHTSYGTRHRFIKREMSTTLDHGCRSNFKRCRSTFPRIGRSEHTRLSIFTACFLFHKSLCSVPREAGIHLIKKSKVRYNTRYATSLNVDCRGTFRIAMDEEEKRRDRCVFKRRAGRTVYGTQLATSDRRYSSMRLPLPFVIRYAYQRLAMLISPCILCYQRRTNKRRNIVHDRHGGGGCCKNSFVRGI